MRGAGSLRLLHEPGRTKDIRRAVVRGLRKYDRQLACLESGRLARGPCARWRVPQLGRVFRAIPGCKDSKTITEEELKRIQSLCHDWLSDPSTNRDSRLTIPAGVVVPHAITIEIKSILTFDDVMITSAEDAEAGTCYTKLIGKSGQPGEFIDTPLEMITATTARPAPPEQSPAQEPWTSTEQPNESTQRRDRPGAYARPI